MLEAIVALSRGRCEAQRIRDASAFDEGPMFRLRVKGVRLRGKTRGAFPCLVRFGTLVCYTAVCFS